jgi:hypothetical protein
MKKQTKKKEPAKPKLKAPPKAKAKTKAKSKPKAAGKREPAPVKGKPRSKVKAASEVDFRMTSDRLKMTDPEDRKTLKGKSESYITGWNKVKYNQSFKTGN